MAEGEVILRFNKVSFAYQHSQPILDKVDFAVRQGSKITLMGQNGAGKSTIFNLIMAKPGSIGLESGRISLSPKITVATARQSISVDQFNLTTREFFQSCFKKKIYDIDPRIDEVLKIVNLIAPHDKVIRSFSGGQQARLLLASALIQNPDLLLLDEPTNNLDKEGIKHLTQFLIDYKKTCIVISHDANFLNAFTQGVLYLDMFTRKIEWYVGNYFDLLAELLARIEKENKKNAQLKKAIQAKKEKANYFAEKGGRLRFVAKKMRQKAETMEKAKVDIRREDKTIRPFIIPSQQDTSRLSGASEGGGEILKITSFAVIKNHKPVKCSADISLRKNNHLLLLGPNGIGKSTLLESLASGKARGAKISSGIQVGYYRQDFSTLNLEDTVYDSLSAVAGDQTEQNLRSIAAGFLITSDLIYSKIGSLSEGQKGLVSFARLVLQRPGLLILDEPTNHINFRHLPIIASALNKYDGAMILVSHVPEFVQQIRIDETLDLEK